MRFRPFRNIIKKSSMLEIPVGIQARNLASANTSWGCWDSSPSLAKYLQWGCWDSSPSLPKYLLTGCWESKNSLPNMQLLRLLGFKPSVFQIRSPEVVGIQALVCPNHASWGCWDKSSPSLPNTSRRFRCLKQRSCKFWGLKYLLTRYLEA